MIFFLSFFFTFHSHVKYSLITQQREKNCHNLLITCNIYGVALKKELRHDHQSVLSLLLLQLCILSSKLQTHVHLSNHRNIMHANELLLSKC